TPRIEPADAIVIPSVLQDDARRMTRGELLGLRRNPDTYGPVIEAKVALAEALRDLQLWGRIRARLADPGPEGGRIRLHPDGAAERSFFVHADDLRRGRFRAENGRVVEVTEFEGPTPRRRLRCDDVRLRRHAAGPLEAVSFDLVLTDCEVVDLEGEQTANRRQQIVLENLVIDGVAVDSLAELSSDELFARAAGLDEDAARYVDDEVRKLHHEIDALLREITGRLLKRYALSATAMLLIVFGATLAMWLRDSLPLVIYLWSFVPAVIDLILISGGEHMLRDGALAGGIAVMWCGNTAVTIFLLLTYRMLSRN
ncbi:MAG: hypothetical protein SYC29_02480, partial [Planctomycetota bacterium]|nr:hypothetical protein [Planctomycetota bacterium]